MSFLGDRMGRCGDDGWFVVMAGDFGDHIVIAIALQRRAVSGCERFPFDQCRPLAEWERAFYWRLRRFCRIKWFLRRWKGLEPLQLSTERTKTRAEGTRWYYRKLAALFESSLRGPFIETSPSGSRIYAS
jgi:hypothetical protein